MISDRIPTLTLGWILGLACWALSACKKDDANVPFYASTEVHFEHQFPGMMGSGARYPDGRFLFSMGAYVPYTGPQLVKLDSDGTLDAGFNPTWPWGLDPGPALPTDDGGSIACASGSGQLTVSRMDATGAMVASRDFVFLGADTPRSIAPTGPSTWVISGLFRQYTPTFVDHHWVMAVDMNCDSLWKRHFPHSHDREISGSIGLANGDLLIISFWTYLNNGPDADMYALRVAPNGGQV